MLTSEFIERTGFYPTFDEYKAIEELYYDWKGDKDDFCAHFKTHKKTIMYKVREIACASFAKERDKIMAQKNKAENESRKIEQRIKFECQSEISRLTSENTTLSSQLKDERENYHSIYVQKNILYNENEELRKKLSQALTDIESLKNAIRLLKQ